MDTTNNSLEKKISRKLKRCQHILEKETGITSCIGPTKIIAICNAGLVNGLTKENILKHFVPYGEIDDIILLPQKSCSFVQYKDILAAEKAYGAIHGKLNIAQNNKPLYLTFTEKVPENISVNICSEYPPGLYLIKEFITNEEENILLHVIDKDQSNSNTMKHRRVMHFGYEFRYDINNVDKNLPLPQKIPRECDFIFNKISKSSNTDIKNFTSDQLTVNDYQPGQGIPPHTDTHSAFEDPILSLSLCSDINMDFRHVDGRHCSVLLPARSLLIMSGESRYAWTHGITPRKMDIISTEQGLTVKERGRRVSFTFRKVLRGECTCKYTDHCDSYDKRIANIESNVAEKLEETHVHKVYEEIASHFSDTRHKPWPNVLDFINSFPMGSVIIDVGCGNGKYLGHNKNNFEVGCDRSFNLTAICQSRGFQAFTCNCLYLPLKSDVADGVISIAVIHHLANEDRRLQAIKEITRILQKDGQALIYVWAKNQEKDKKSNYLKQDRKKSEKVITSINEQIQSVEIEDNLSLPVHVNRTQFKNRDLLVPWKLKGKSKEIALKEVSKNSDNLFLRYYHVFEEGELEKLCKKIENISVMKSYYDEGNCCVILKKI